MELTTKVISADQLSVAAQLLKSGECVAFPTETVYGLGANALNEQAVAKIFAAKKRPTTKPLIIHIYAYEQIAGLTDVYDPEADQLMQTFWPGPLSVILPKSSKIPGIVTAFGSTVALRMPDNRIALDLFRLVDLPIAAPSANISGKASPTTADQVYHNLKGRIPLIIDGGTTKQQVASTVVDCTTRPFKILRLGSISLKRLQAVADVELAPNYINLTEMKGVAQCEEF